MTGALTREWCCWPLPDALLLPWLAGAQDAVWALRPATLALTPQTVTFALPALTGAFATEP